MMLMSPQHKGEIHVRQAAVSKIEPGPSWSFERGLQWVRKHRAVTKPPLISFSRIFAAVSHASAEGNESRNIETPVPDVAVAMTIMMFWSMLGGGAAHADEPARTPAERKPTNASARMLLAINSASHPLDTWRQRSFFTDVGQPGGSAWTERLRTIDLKRCVGVLFFVGLVCIAVGLDVLVAPDVLKPPPCPVPYLGSPRG